MKKQNFVSMVMGTIGGLLFGIGMSLALLPETMFFNQGVGIGALGALVLIAMAIVRRKMAGKPPIKLDGKTIGTIAFGVIGTLIFGVGLCMTMVWEGLMVQGISVGIVGIILLMCLIPICKGLK